VKLLLHAEELVALVLVDRAERDAGPPGDDLVDLLLAHHDSPGVRRDVEALADGLEALAGRHFLVAVELRALEVPLRDRALHLLHGDADTPVDLAEFPTAARVAQLGARPRLVDEVDGLVGQEPVGDVAAGLVGGRLDRLARVLDVVELLVAILDPEEDLDRLGLRRGIHLDRLEPPFERPVLLDVLPVLGRRRRADAANLATRERRLEDAGSVERAFGRPRANQRVQLVDEHDDVRVVGQFLHDRLEAFLELAAVLRPGDDQREVERQQPLVGEEVRHVAEDDPLRESLDDGRLPDARFADENGVVLGAAAQHLLHPLDLGLAAHEGIQLVLDRGLGEVAAELRKQRRLFRPGQRGLLVEQLNRVLPDRIQPHAVFHQDRRGDRALLAQDAKQQVLGPDVVVKQPVGLLGGKPQHPLGLGAERDLDRRGHLLAEHGPPLDLLADALERQVRPTENAGRQPLPLPDQSQQQVLGFNRDAAKLTGFVPGEEKDPPRPFRIPFEHLGYPRHLLRIVVNRTLFAL